MVQVPADVVIVKKLEVVYPAGRNVTLRVLGAPVPPFRLKLLLEVAIADKSHVHVTSSFHNHPSGQRFLTSFSLLHNPLTNW